MASREAARRSTPRALLVLGSLVAAACGGAGSSKGPSEVPPPQGPAVAPVVTVAGAATSAGAALVTSGRSYVARFPERSGYTYGWSCSNCTVGSPSSSGGFQQATVLPGAAGVDGAAAPASIAVTEATADGASTATGTLPLSVFVAPAQPAITIVKVGQATALDKVSDGTAFAYTVSVAAQPGVHYTWTLPAGSVATPASPDGAAAPSFRAGSSFDVTFTSGMGAVAGVAASIGITAANDLGDTAPVQTRAFTIYAAPVAPVIATSAITDANGFKATVGRTYAASFTGRGGADTVQWAPATNVQILTGDTAPSATFQVIAANGDDTEKAALLAATVRNGAGDAATGSLPGLAFPAASPPAVTIRRPSRSDQVIAAGVASLTGKLTAVDVYTVTVDARRAQRSHAISLGDTTRGCLVDPNQAPGPQNCVASLLFSPAAAGSPLTVQLHAKDFDPSGAASRLLALAVREVNAIGDGGQTAADLTAYATPRTPQLTFEPADRRVTAGDALPLSVAAPRGGMLYRFDALNGSFPGGAGSAVGKSTTLGAGAADPANLPDAVRPMVLTLVEVNGNDDESPVGPGDQVIDAQSGNVLTGRVTFSVYPRPVAHLLTTPAAVTSGDTLALQVPAAAGMRYLWNVTWTPPGGAPVAMGGPGVDAQGLDTFSVVAPDTAPGTTGTLLVAVDEVNALGVVASSAPANSVTVFPRATENTLTIAGTDRAPGSTFHLTSGAGVPAVVKDSRAVFGYNYLWTVLDPSALADRLTGVVTNLSPAGDAGTLTVTLGNPAAGPAAFDLVSTETSPLGAGVATLLHGIAHPAPSVQTIALTQGGTPASTNVAEGVTYVASVAATARPDMSYAWTIGGGVITSSPTATTISFQIPGPLSAKQAVTLAVRETNGDPDAPASVVTSVSLVAYPAPRSETIADLSAAAWDGRSVTAGTPLVSGVPARADVVYAWTVDPSSTSVPSLSGGSTASVSFTPPAFAPTGDAPTRTLKLNLDERNTPADGAPAVSTATLTVYPNPASVSSVTVLDGGDQPHTAGVTTGVTYRAVIGRPTVPTMSYRYTITGGGCFQVPDCVSEITCPGAGTACGDGSATFTADLARGSTVAVAVEELNAIGAASPAVSSGAQPVLAPPAPPAITAFSLAGVAGTIDEAGKAIAVTVPHGAALTALVATFTTTGVSVKVGATAQTSGVTANDFTSPVAYVVTSAGGSTVAYTVTVTPAPNPAKAITAFSLAGVDATIDESGKAIAVTVPYGTDATALVATFTTSGASVEVGTTAQTSGVTANDFTNPVKYTVTAADGSTSTYTVTVTVAGPPDPLPRTGQTVSYATGDDGNLLKGEAWPSPRFTTNADTTVTDHLTGLVWAPDASTPGPGACNPGGTRTWQGAVDHVACLNANAYLDQTDWRLPNRNELRSLSHYGQPDAAAWLDGQGFTSASSGNFWSSTIYLPAYSLYVWIAGIEGSLDGSSATSLLRVWPVRTGSSPGAIALPVTGQTTCLDATMAPIACAGTGQDGDLRAGAAWPSPRFTVNGDTTVTDNLTGRTWTAAANSPGPGPCPGGLKTWQAALGHVACLNANGYLGHSDWRLPNIHELESLANPNESSTATWLMTQGFGYVPTSYYLWSSTTVASNTSLRWIVDMNGGGVYGYPKTDTYFVWPVR